MARQLRSGRIAVVIAAMVKAYSKMSVEEDHNTRRSQTSAKAAFISSNSRSASVRVFRLLLDDEKLSTLPHATVIPLKIPVSEFSSGLPPKSNCFFLGLHSTIFGKSVEQFLRHPAN